MTRKFLIIAHTGAGNYSFKREEAYKQTAENACSAAYASLINNSNSDLISAAAEGIRALENSPITNAGIGSNLTLNGQVECESGIMCGRSKRYGAVGAVRRIKNPIDVSEALLKSQIATPTLSYGRCPPNVLVGTGAEDWANELGIKLIDNSELILKRKKEKYMKYKELISNNGRKCKKRSIDEDGCNIISKKIHENQDTVGVIVLEVGVGIVSATSSGGIALKYDGRLGQSCIFGAGCYAETYGVDVLNSVGAVSTGLGEQLVRSMLPLRLCDHLKFNSEQDCYDLIESFNKFIKTHFMESEFVLGDDLLSFGILAINCRIENHKAVIDVLYGHSTPALCFAVYSSNTGMNSFMSRLPDDSQYTVASVGEVLDV